MRFVDLFAGLGGFRVALERLGCKCAFACESDDELRKLYAVNFPRSKTLVAGDILDHKNEIPPHDVLCAGFPCQPFSKSGQQLGKQDKTRGTLFHEVINVLTKHRPEYLILENVGNFERHDQGRTWQIVRESLQELGYNIKGTEHVRSGGPGLLSPHHLGFPHSRERFFIVGCRGKLPDQPFPTSDRARTTSLAGVVQPREVLTDLERQECELTTTQMECISHWNNLLAQLPEDEVDLPSFPIWGDEIDASYPFENTTPSYAPLPELIASLNGAGNDGMTRDQIVNLLPRYARKPDELFPAWKRYFIRENRRWFREIKTRFPPGWVERLMQFPPSLRKLEWNCHGENRDLWKCVLQFRPSGLRAKRYTSVPALVAMTTTQIPILGPERRFITRTEGLRLQGFPDDFNLPSSREAAFRALGNAVHVGVVEAIARKLLPVASHSRGLSKNWQELASVREET